MNNVCLKMARLIDISAVQAQSSKEDVDACVELAKKYNIISVHVLPNWTSYLQEEFKDYPEIYIGAPIGFPSGGHATSTKIAEIHQSIADGARELDMVVNIGRVLAGDYEYVRNELCTAVKAAHPIPMKVILEVHYLNEEQIRKVTELAIEAGMYWVKTGTGWTPTGATIENCSIMANQANSRIDIKASGSVRSLELIRDLYAVGVRRFGLGYKTALTVLNQLEENPELFPELNQN